MSDVPAARPRNEVARFAMAAVFGGIGVLHFTSPEGFEAIVPDQVPAKRGWVYATGVMEVAGAAALVARPTRRVGWLLVGLLALVFPANVHQALTGTQVPGLPPQPRWALFARLPMQAVMVWAVLAATRPEPEGGRP
ncbi:MAG: hypothetical protein U0P45_12200 [Acidimicrobiales bacterium]